MKELKRILSLVLCCAMLVGIVPFNSFAFAAETEESGLTAALAEAKAYIDGITVNSAANDPATVVGNFGTHFTWDNEKRESSKSYLFDWSYYNGVVFEGLEYLYEVTGEEVYRSYVVEYMSAMIAEDGTWAKCVNNTAKEAAGYNATHGADCYKTASLLLDAYAMTADQRYLTIAKVLYDDLTAAEAAYSLTNAGGNFRHTWASDPSPDLWLDGLYMILPFRAEYAKFSNDTAELDQIVSRMQWVSDNMYDSATGLFYHAADSATSNSGTFWLRSIGWYAAAIVDIMDSMEGENLEAMKAQLVKLVEGMAACQNESNGMWLNNMAASESSANPYETSGTALVCYAVMKAVNEGWLDESYADMALLAFEGICAEKLEDNNLTDICFKGAPGSSNSTFYDNEGKGLGPFIMFYAEVLEYVNAQESETPDPTDPTEPEPTEPEETEPEVTEPEVTDQTVTDGVGVSATVSGVSATLAGALLTEEDKALLDEKDYVNYIALDVAGVVAQGETALVTFAIPAHWTSGRVVGIHVEDGTVVEIPGLLQNGTLTFAVSHFSAVGIALLAETSVSKSGNLVGGKVYTLNTDGVIDTNKTYLIVNSGTDGNNRYVLTNSNGSVTSTTVTVSGGKITVDNDSSIAWTLGGTSSGTISNNGLYLNPTMTYNGYRPVYGVSLQTGTQSLSIASQGGGEYHIYRTSNYMNYYVYYDGGWTCEVGRSWETNDFPVYLYELTSSSSGEEVTFTVTPGSVSINLLDTDTQTLTGTVTVGGESVDLSKCEITWTSADESVATVDEDGTVTGVAPGTANITVTLTAVDGTAVKGENDADGITLTIPVTVGPEIGFEEDHAYEIEWGETIELDPPTVSVNGVEYDGDYTVDWSNPSNDAITFDPDTMKVTGANPGTATITATLREVENLSVDKTITYTVTVKTPDIVVSDGANSVKVGEQITLVPTVKFNGEAVDLSECSFENWTSADETIAAVDGNGVVTGVAEGTVKVTATLTKVGDYEIPESDCPEVEFTVTVVTKQVERIRLLQTMATVLVGTDTGAPTGAQFVLVYEDGSESDPMDITIDMLSSTDPNVEISTAEPAEFRELKVTYGEEFTAKELFDLVVVAPPDMNYPEYPNPGSVDVNKVISDYSMFQSQGIVGIDLSTAGLPVHKGVNVILIADISNSMSWDDTEYNYADAPITAGSNQRLNISKVSIKNFISGLLADYEDETKTNNTFTLLAFAGIDGDFNDHNTAAANDDVYQLGALAMQDMDEANAAVDQLVKATTGGTNYDYAFQQAYSLAQQLYELNGQAVHIVFMTDGAPTHYNGVYYKSRSNTDLTAMMNYIDPTTGEKSRYTSTGNDRNGNDIDATATTPITVYYNDGSTETKTVTYNKGWSDYITGNKNGWAEKVKSLDYVAKVYSIGFGMKNGSVTQGATDSMPTVSGKNGGNYYIPASTTETVLKHIASTSDDYYSADGTEELSALYASLASSIAEAATNAYFVDQMGDKFSLQMHTTEAGFVPTITVSTFDVYKQSDVDGETVTQDMVGSRKGVGKIQETVSFNPDGTEAYSNLVLDANGEQINILNLYTDENKTFDNGVIYAKNFWYNTNRTTVIIDADGDGDAELPTAENGSTDFELEGETFRWNIGTINDQEFVLTYYAYLEGSMDGTAAAGTYKTNNYATLYYKNWLGNDAQQSVESPSTAWESAAFYYGFYLVDSEGNPVTNRATGATGSFYDAVKVTKKVLYSEMPLNSTGITDLEKLLANNRNILPEGYALFDSEAAYQVTVRSNGGGNWVITNGKPVPTTYVTDYHGSEATTENISDPEGTAGVDFTSTTVWFAVVWEPGTLPDTVVIDYGLPVDIDVLSNDMFGTAGTLYGVAGSLPQMTYANGNYNLTESDLYSRTWTGQYGTVELNNGKVRYTPNTTEMPGYERFYYEVKYTATVKADGETFTEDQFYYGTVTVIPATTIYYEDSFLEFEGVGTEWEDEGTEKTDATQQEDRPGFYSLTDYNNIYGYDPVNLGMSTHSLGHAKKVHVNADSYATATFTFWGTGFDVISMTSNKTGMLFVQVVDNENGVAVKNIAVDTYYGYTYGLYQVCYTWGKTVWNGTYAWNREVLDEAPAGAEADKGDPPTTAPEEGEEVVYRYEYCWKMTPDEDKAIYQVPVIQVEGLEYGNYTATITAAYADSFDHTKPDGFDLYLDAIRIYDPANDGASDGSDDTTIEDAYVADGEGWPTYLELRDQILAEDVWTFGDTISNGIIQGIVFIDGDDPKGNDLLEVKQDRITDYENYGPNNEVYLAPGQRVAFILKLPEKFANVHFGIKSADGQTCTYTIMNIATGQDASGTAIEDANGNKIGTYFGAKTYTLSTTTDMYYNLASWKDAIIVISNTGNRPENGTEGIISLTNIKFTYTENPTPSANGGAGNEGQNNGANVAQASKDVVNNELGYVYMTKEAADATIQILNSPDYHGDSEQIPQPEPEPEPTFKPRFMLVKLSRDWVRVGNRVLVTVLTGPDVENLVVNGQVVTRCTYSRWSRTKTWIIEIPAEAVGTMEISVVAYNADGEWSEPVLRTVTVRDAKVNPGEDRRDWIYH